jgi:cell division protein FtsL
MIDRTVVPIPSWHGRQDAQAKTKSIPTPTPAPPEEAVVVNRTTTIISASDLLRFLLMILVVWCLTCVYIWQLSKISRVNMEAEALRTQIADLEHENVDLMLQVAAQNTPGQIERQAASIGMVPFARSVYISLSPEPASADQPALASTEADQPAPWWQQWITSLTDEQIVNRVIEMVRNLGR